MTKPIDPFSRLYWRLIDDEKFVDIYPNDRHFALWARLLMAADMSWPASASLPYGTRPASLQKLCDVGLIDVLPGHRYRVRGLDAERGKRQEKASSAAAARYQKPEQPPSSANGVPIKQASKTEQASTRAREGLPHIGAAVQEAGESITGQGILSAGDKQLTELDRLCESHGDAAVIAAFRKASNGAQKSWRQLVWDSVKVIEPFATPQDTRAVEDDAAEQERWAKARAENKRRAEELGITR